MKKLFLSLGCVLISLTVSAQKGFSEKSNFGIAGHVVIDYGGYGEPVSGNVQIMSNRILLDVSMHSFENGFSGGIHAGYIFNIIPKLNIYPLLGVCLQANANSTDTKFAFGAGAQYHLTGALFGSARVTSRDAGIGLGFNF